MAVAVAVMEGVRGQGSEKTGGCRHHGGASRCGFVALSALVYMVSHPVRSPSSDASLEAGGWAKAIAVGALSDVPWAWPAVAKT